MAMHLTFHFQNALCVRVLICFSSDLSAEVQGHDIIRREAGDIDCPLGSLQLHDGDHDEPCSPSHRSLYICALLSKTSIHFAFIKPSERCGD